MRRDRGAWIAAVAPGALLAALALGGAALLAATLDPAERAAVAALLEPRAGLLLPLWLVVSAALGALSHRAYLRRVAAPARLAEEAQLFVASDVRRAIEPFGSEENRALTSLINELVRQRAELRDDLDRKVIDASRDIELERSRLAALMAELTQSVVVCNLEGRILLYNNRARLQFRALSNAPGVAGGGELIGLGRSIYAVLDEHLVAHALESIRHRLSRGAAHPSAQLVTSTRAGQLLRLQMAPVRAIGSEPETAPALNGFVLMLDNITRDYAEETERDLLLHSLTERSRASLGVMLAAVEMLDLPDVDAASRERFQGVIRDEVRAMSERIRGLATHTARTRWPLEEMQGADLVSAALRRIESQLGCRAAAVDVDAALWLRVDSYSLLQALVHLAGRLVEEYDVKLITLRLGPAGPRAQLDLVWAGQAMSTETAAGWEMDAIRVGSQTLSLTVRDVVERHDGAFWFERERTRHETFFRFLLPLAQAGAEADAAQPAASRPDFYDFDLFRTSDRTRELADRLLGELSYTVFDTETTGLDPSAGDEIIQIGATRIVQGKLHREECFEQLVDPRRSIAAASLAIHGIGPDRVAGQPTIDRVLPAFHAFARDTVLVAHNAAFDMRFLEVKQAVTGIVFDQPVLDTLLLSTVIHPQQESHALEAIAARLDVAVRERHSALGDAIVTAEVFLRLLPLLEKAGIRTLGQALAASQKSFYARLSY